jgi:transposase
MSKSMQQVKAVGNGLAGPQRSEGERSEPERSGGPAKPSAGSPGGPPDPEVKELCSRRRFSAAYKADVVQQAMACREHGEIGALLRREGLYSSQLSAWRAQYERGALRGLADDMRGRKSKRNPLDGEVQRLRKQNARLEGRLRQAEAIIEIQKKVSEILGIPLAKIDEDEGDC